MGLPPEAFAFDLPPEQIAQAPTPRRRDARLMVLAEQTRHHHVSGLGTQLATLCHGIRPLVVLNHSSVLPARLHATRESDGRRFELLICRPGDDGVGDHTSAWVRRAKKLRVGDRLCVGELVLELCAPTAAGDVGADPVDARARVFHIVAGSMLETLGAYGELPLPPYMRRPQGPTADDLERYQTVFAQTPGSVAAPTASLHFDHELLAELDTVALSLHVGPGTFLPMEVQDVDTHRVGAERYEVGAATLAKIVEAKAQGRPVVAVGTTVTRTLESLARAPGGLAACAERAAETGPLRGETDLVIRPGHPFAVVDLLMTNFHLPQSSLLMLVCAFGGRARVLEAYATAVQAGYRFYSFGDAMLVAPISSSAW